ncbi:hypothetical protein CsatB_020691 [Cannabis sativa]
METNAEKMGGCSESGENSNAYELTNTTNFQVVVSWEKMWCWWKHTKLTELYYFYFSNGVLCPKEIIVTTTTTAAPCLALLLALICHHSIQQATVEVHETRLLKLGPALINFMEQNLYKQTWRDRKAQETTSLLRCDVVV